jgi:hypothetical protein
VGGLQFTLTPLFFKKKLKKKYMKKELKVLLEQQSNATLRQLEKTARVIRRIRTKRLYVPKEGRYACQD